MKKKEKKKKQTRKRNKQMIKEKKKKEERGNEQMINNLKKKKKEEKEKRASKERKRLSQAMSSKSPFDFLANTVLNVLKVLQKPDIAAMMLGGCYFNVHSQLCISGIWMSNGYLGVIRWPGHPPTLAPPKAPLFQHHIMCLLC